MRFLGLDVGGTNCRFEWWPAGSAAGGDAKGVQPAVHGIEATVRGLDAVLARAADMARPAGAVCALAGAGDPEVRRRIEAALLASGRGFPVAVVGDVLAAAAAALRDGPGVFVSSGTGSFAVSRGPDGELVRVGGRGYLLGDQGSGYDVVRRAAAAALDGLDGLGPPTALAAALTAAFGAPAPERLGAVIQQLEPREVARHLGIVVDVAARGDPVARGVIGDAVAALERLLAAAAARAGLPVGAPVSLGGGALGVPAICGELIGRLTAGGWTIRSVLGERDAARAAAWLAHGVHEGLEPQTSWVQRVTL